ncbi:MAG: MFS transporter [Bacteroidota bacterium]
MKDQSSLYSNILNRAVIISGLGFFVDAFDLLLFNVLRIPSLKDLGLSGSQLTSHGEFLLSMQMLGMIVGGIISGVVGDRRGRVSVLFGSILLYSLANFANAFVEDVSTYAVIRFLAGVGLAGELGAGIALVGESMTIEHRGNGTVMVAVLGACGAIAAGLAGDLLPWRTTYIIAGVAGLLLLLLRVYAFESGMYRKAEAKQDVKRGSFRLLFSTKERTMRYLKFLIIGIPIWYCVGILINLSPELAARNGIQGISPFICFILFQVGIATGDLSSGLLSQRLKTRISILKSFMAFAILAVIAFFISVMSIKTPTAMSVCALLMGFGCGFMSIFVTTVAESFGTNLRVTATATITNFMRGAVTVLIPLRMWLERQFTLSMETSLILIGILVLVPAFLFLFRLKETYGTSLEYYED